MSILVQLTVGAEVEQSAGGVIGTGAESLTVGEELHRVDVGLVTQKCLDTFAGPNVPDLCCGIAGTRDEDLLLRRNRKT